ncbi:hypothetical protein [Flavobacterium reichenbachii]|uniref:hypothetical protein n=1 Tax=Flavobacterium reichenbachii TaxID=362418 RepID=UPI000A5CA3BA|nr:hypothetical protein [Flavobacterium reichenbachii]
MKEIINSNEKDNKSLLNDDQKEAIDKALEDVENGKMYSHQEVMDETKKRFPHLFNRI